MNCKPSVAEMGQGMTDDRRWVLVTDGRDGRGRDTVAAVRGLAAGGYHPAVTVISHSWGSAPSRFCARRVQVPPVTSTSYTAAVQAELKSGSYLALLPTSEEALAALGVSRPDLLDKTTMSQAAAEAGLQVPPSQLFLSRKDAINHSTELEYPVVIKPTRRRYWAFRADHPDQFATGMVREGPVIVQPYIEQPPRAISGIVWQGRMLAAVHERWLRIWPVYCGLASAAETISPDREMETRLLSLLAGYQGIFSAQFVGDYLIDVNLRVHSSHPLAVAAGVNLVALYCDLLRGEEVQSVRAREGVFYRWLEGDIRHVIKAVRGGRMSRGEALQTLRPRRGTVHSTESLRDPLAMVERIVSGLTRRVSSWTTSGEGIEYD